MPTLLPHAQETPIPLAPPRKRWTGDQCAPLEASGLFVQERLELVDSDIIARMGKNRPHVNASQHMPEWLQQTFGRRFIYADAPIDVNPADNQWNEPVPDPIVLKRDEFPTFLSGNPDSSLAFDLSTKAVLHAQWVLDVGMWRLIVHRDPVAGRYGSPLALPTAEFRPATAFPG